MSNIYIQEPPTSGKVLLKTSVGEIEIELWAKEAPKTCRNFIQMCYDKVYDGSPFYRLVRSFIVQCGEFNKRVDCIEPFKNEFHSRIRFSRRGLVALALTQDDAGDNTMEFFITLDAAPELNNKHTIFGKVTGETIYNVLKLNDSPTDANDRPINPHKINKVKILHSPFTDISPRFISSKDESKSSSKSKREKGVKNFKLISFGDEAEQDEECLKDFEPSTSAAAVPKPSKKKIESSDAPSPHESSDGPSQHESSDGPSHHESKVAKAKSKSKKDESSDSDDYLTTVEQEKRSELEKKRKQIQDEIADLKKDYQSSKKGKVVTEVLPEPQHQDEAVRTYLKEKEKYKTDKLKGKSREEFTLSLLNKFKTKLTSASEKETTQDDNSDDENWLSHKLDFSDSRDAVLAKDASKKEDDWYDIYDPRNPLNKRKRGAEKSATSGEAPTKKSK